MSKCLTFLLFLSFSLTSICAQTDSKNQSINKKELQKQIQAQMEREKKYAKEQMFYKGDDYNLSEAEVDPSTLDNVPVIEPEYDFDITDVYRDDI